jgi:hypothetical protein
LSIVLNEHFEEDGELVFSTACQLGCEGIVSKRLGSPYRSGRSPHWVKVKNPNAPAAKREAEEVTMPPFPPDDFAIQVLLPAARDAQLIPGAEAEPDYSTTSLRKFASRGRPFPLS